MFKNFKIKPEYLNNKKTKIDYLKLVFAKIKYFDTALKSNRKESLYINEGLQENEKEALKQICKNKKLLTAYNANKEITEYINNIFEQQEKERLVRWIVTSIREFLDLDKVLTKTVEELGCLLNVDRCYIALYDENNEKFFIKNEFRADEQIPSIFDIEDHILSRLDLLPPNWYRQLFVNNNPIIVNSTDKETLEKDKLHEQHRIYLDSCGIKSFIILPLAHQDIILGVIVVSQISYKREWQNTNLEILKDTGSQIAIAIRQATLYAKAQESTKLKSEFLANMSHEFRTPLNAIIGFSDMLLSENYGELNEKQKKFMDNISISGKHLLNLVSDILDHSKIEAGSMQLNYEFFDINHAISETVSVLKDMSMKKNIDINISTEKNLIINADIGRFKQILFNLISNAIKFTEDGGKISITSMLYNTSVKIEIIDTGIGILPEDKNKIFKKFTQLDASYTKKQDGAGLGLALTKKLVEMHRGNIGFESEKDKGSTFWFVMPKAKRVNSGTTTVNNFLL